MTRIGVLISGGGTNLQSLIDATQAGTIDGEIAVVISNRKEAFGLERARKNKIADIYIGKGNFPIVKDAEVELLKVLEEHRVDVVVLAGYLNIVSPEVIDRYRNKIINVHPSLIPAYSGAGYYGRKVHEAVIENKENFSGATVHFVDEGTDTGAIIVQEKVVLSQGETPETLAKKVLVIEHKILVETTAKLCLGNL